MDAIVRDAYNLRVLVDAYPDTAKVNVAFGALQAFTTVYKTLNMEQRALLAHMTASSYHDANRGKKYTHGVGPLAALFNFNLVGDLTTPAAKGATKFVRSRGAQPTPSENKRLLQEFAAIWRRENW